MKELHTDSVQNRFSAYLVAAITNNRIRYMENRKRLHDMESAQRNLPEKDYMDFDMQYRDYISEQASSALQDWERFEEWLVLLESEKLLKAVDRLKDRDRRLLFARVFGGLTFGELGRKFDMKPEQAEMAYYYILRKLRKELEEGLRHGFQDGL